MNIHTAIGYIVQRQTTFGCGNHGCLFRKVIGQGTNSGCRCQQQIASAVIDYYIKNREDFNRQIDYQLNYSKMMEEKNDLHTNQ